MARILAYTIILIPFLLTGLNIYAFVAFLTKKKDKTFFKILEVTSIFIGLFYLYLYVNVNNVLFVAWDTQLFNQQKHSMIAPDYFLTVFVLCVVAFFGYVYLRLVPAQKQPPLCSALGISSVYLGIGTCILWSVQTFGNFACILLSANYILVFVKTICITVYQKNLLIQEQSVSIKYKKLARILDNALHLPWVALVLLIPLLGILVAVLFLFGQEPSSIIKAWTETSEWNLSQHTAPRNIQYDEHYLCTVAAGGHPKVVKPLRGGMRHGHQVVVNRQLCVANAFEQVLEKKLPGFHRLVRTVYDRVGYPISRHIHSQYWADAIYFLMKPLEWLFLLVLYAVDVHPENRIAVQYPHKSLPMAKEQL